MIFTYKDLGNCGRLGNQLSQLSATISTAIDHKSKFVFPNWKYEKFFNLHNCYSDNIQETKNYREPDFKYTKIKFPQTEDIINLQGYFQSEKYFKNNEVAIRLAFSSTNPIPTQKNKTGIHVRRGDYLNLSEYHTNLSMSYYHQAMKLARSEKYVIFSDDIEWCKKNFIGDQFEFSEGSEIDDFNKMRSMGSNIIANSSFSWWAAYLNNNQDKKVIAPSNWFGPKLNHDTSDLIPNDWIII